MPATTASIVALVGLAVSVAIGSWWTATAVQDGDPVGLVVRIALTYYMVWLRNQGHEVPSVRIRRRD